MGRPGTFLPGRSGNPGGRPKQVFNINSEAGRHAKKALESLVDIIEHGDSEAARVSAIRELLDRAYGKAAEHMSGQIDHHLVIECRGLPQDVLTVAPEVPIEARKALA